jgi:hypothetical protein
MGSPSHVINNMALCNISFSHAKREKAKYIIYNKNNIIKYMISKERNRDFSEKH